MKRREYFEKFVHIEDKLQFGWETGEIRWVLRYKNFKIVGESKDDVWNEFLKKTKTEVK